MNLLLVGTNKHFDPKPDFLLIDDGPIADAFEKKFKTARVFDPTVHSFNPLPADHKRARDIASTLYSFDTSGKDTLTVRNGKRALARLLLKADRLDRVKEDRTDPAEAEALAVVDEVLFSPVVRKALCGKPFSFKGSVIARLDRAVLGDFDAFILGSLLIGQFKGQVIVPDFGFYGRLSHVSLIRQNRLMCGVNYLEELEPKLRQAVLLMPKEGHGCTYDDACTLADYAGLARGTDGYSTFVGEAM